MIHRKQHHTVATKSNRLIPFLKPNEAPANRKYRDTSAQLAESADVVMFRSQKNILRNRHTVGRCKSIFISRHYTMQMKRRTEINQRKVNP